MNIAQAMWSKASDSILRADIFYGAHRKPLNRLALLAATEACVFTRGWTPYMEIPLAVGTAVGIGVWSLFASGDRPKYAEAFGMGIGYTLFVSVIGSLVSYTGFYGTGADGNYVPNSVEDQLKAHCRVDGATYRLYDRGKTFDASVRIYDEAFKPVSEQSLTREHYAVIKVSFPYKHFVDGKPDIKVTTYQTDKERGPYTPGSKANCSPTGLTELRL